MRHYIQESDNKKIMPIIPRNLGSATGRKEKYDFSHIWRLESFPGEAEETSFLLMT